MKLTTEEIFAILPPGVQDEMINDLLSKVGAMALGEIHARDPAGLSEWLCRAYGKETHVALEAALQPVGDSAGCANCGADGSFEECGKCGGRAYFIAARTSMCKTCGIRQESVSPERDGAGVDSGEELPF